MNNDDDLHKYSDYDKDLYKYSDEDYDDNDDNIQIETDIKETNMSNVITTEGLLDNDNIYKKMSFQQKKNTRKCTFCFKNYNVDMFVDYESIELMCWHCLFWLNYDINNRKDVDGNLGMCISEYIHKCQQDHNIELCTKRTDQGGCFLCEYKLGYVLTDIKDPCIIYDMDKINIDTNLDIKDENNLSDVEDESSMTVFI